MGYEYVSIDGARVEKTVAAAYAALEAEFRRVWGLDLIISSGTRTRAEQDKLYSDYINGRGGLAAKGGTSNHEENGPRGPRALDLRDSGLDAGVTRKGSARANWLRANAPRFGFNPAGYGFSSVEPWHYEFTGAIGNYAAPASTTVGVQQVVKDRQNFLNQARGERLVVDGIFGPATKAAIMRYQKFLGVSADGIWGPKTQAAHHVYWQKLNAPKPRPKPVAGKTTASFGSVSAVQRALRRKYPLYAGRLAVDGIDGPATKAAVREFQRRAGLVVDGIAGPATRRALGI